MTFLSKVFGCFSFLTRRHSSGQYSKGNQECSSIDEEPIQRPPEDTDVEEKMGYEDSLDEMEILPDFSTAAEPVMIQVEEPQYQNPLTIFPRSSTTVAKPLLIQVAPLHPLPDEVETGPSFSTTAEPLMVQFEEPEKEAPPDEEKKLPCSSIKVTETLMFQEATWHLTLPGEEEILSSVAEPVMVQMAPAEVEQERPPERRGRRRTKKERKTDSSTIKRPDATPPPAKPKLAWMDSPVQNTKADEEMMKKEREVENETPENQETESVEMIVEVDLRQERRMKKERKTEYATPPPAKVKFAWMETDNTKVTHTKKREDEKERLEIQANKIEDTKAANITPPPAMGKRMNVQESECSSKISQQSSRRWKGFHLIYKLAEKKSAAEKEKKETRKEEKRQRKLLHEKCVNDPSMKHLLINKYNKFNHSYSCGLTLFI